MSFNNSSYSNKKNNSPFLSASNFASGGFLGMFNSPSQNTSTSAMGAISSNSGATPTNTGAPATTPTLMNTPADVNTRVNELEKRLRKLETGGGFFGGGRQRRKTTRKNKSRKC
jgi:hypothetical protein